MKYVILLTLAVTIVLITTIAVQRIRKPKETPWDWYSTPCGKNFNDWEVGVRATTAEGVVEKHVVREWKGRHPDIEERGEVEGMAMTLAATFNSSREHRI